MTTTHPDTAGSGWISKLLVVLLLATAIGLYLQIVMVDHRATEDGPPRQASVRVIEAGPSEPGAAAPAGSGVKELPEDQMDLIRQVFAPEMDN